MNVSLVFPMEVSENCVTVPVAAIVDQGGEALVFTGYDSQKEILINPVTLAGKARPWILLSALSLSVASVLMFVVPFQGTARYIWIAIAYNLYYAVAYPIYNTANSTLIPLSTRDSEKRSALASMTNVAGLGVMGAGSMVFPILVANLLT